MGLATAAGACGRSSRGRAAPASAEAALQVQAQELAGEIQADGRNLDQLAETLDAAQIRSQQLTTQLRALRATVAKTDGPGHHGQDRRYEEQAVISYVAGGAPLTTNVPAGRAPIPA